MTLVLPACYSSASYILLSLSYVTLSLRTHIQLFRLQYSLFNLESVNAVIQTTPQSKYESFGVYKVFPPYFSTNKYPLSSSLKRDPQLPITKSVSQFRLILLTLPRIQDMPFIGRIYMRCHRVSLHPLS